MRSTPVIILAGIFVSAIYAGAAVAQASKTDQTSKASQRAAPAMSQRSGETVCPNGFPLDCPGTGYCCPADMPNFCQSLTRVHPDGLAPVGWSGCVRPATNESWKFWSDGCQPIWMTCR